MRARPLAVFAVIAPVAVAGACSKAPAPAEDVTSAALPPITICYEPDGAPCPLVDGGDDAGDATLDADGAGGAEAGRD
jgi:hypothetical protein